MNYIAQTIKNRLSLRPPQTESLRILSEMADILKLKKGSGVAAELKKVHDAHPTCTDFERDFPSLTFSLATGVGKTRLMGAFVAYLFLVKGIKNFFVLAPGTTIYNKLVDDFSNPRSSKYVFRGIAEFAQMPPRIITSDNYAEARTNSLFGESVKINVFNIQRINSEVRGGREPRIKRLSEYLGESYFNYLSELPDLVLMMDESHHYRGDAGLKAINELKPILGLELTATPIDTKGKKFKNVVYEYSLAAGLRDGFLKEPAIATRRDFNPEQYRNDPKELDLIKLQDGVRLHEDTKVALDIYARDTGARPVKPFVLVVARDTDHAKEVRELIESDRFFGGRYKGKVMEIHSNQRGEEKEENIQRLLELENPANNIEIVIHVNMLKEGWDVTNLYTIIPLRASNSQILTEQTIGRGLRLPYGKRTGVEKVDKLTIIAHDRFQSIVDAANDPNSIIRRENIIEINPDDLPQDQTIISSWSVLDSAILERRRAVEIIADPEKKRDAGFVLDAKQAMEETMMDMGDAVKNIGELKTADVQKLVFEKLTKRIEAAPQQNLFKQQILDAAKQEYQKVAEEVIEKTIPIPRILIEQGGAVESGFHDFDLEVGSLNYQPVSEEIVRRSLQTNESEILQRFGGSIIRDSLENVIVNELINFPEVDYERDVNLLHKVADQAVKKLSAGKSEDDVLNIVTYQKRNIGQYIYAQLKPHFYVKSSGFEVMNIHPFSRIEPHNFSKDTRDSIHHYSETITPTHSIPSKVFGGFKKACHSLYKFQSKAEKDFAAILETDKEALRWLRPAQAQFAIYYQHNSKRYVPDFVVETKEAIYMIEIKAENEIENANVQEKARAGSKYCETASNFNKDNGGKAWHYILLPHTVIAPNMSFEGLRQLDEFDA